MEKSGVDEDDILEAARLIHGMEKIEDIKYAILERDEAFPTIPSSTLKS